MTHSPRSAFSRSARRLARIVREPFAAVLAGASEGSGSYLAARPGAGTMSQGPSRALPQRIAVPNRARRNPVQRIVPVRVLGIVIFLATVGLADSHQACAQVPLGSLDGEGFTVHLASLTDDEISDICARYKSQPTWVRCWNNYRYIRQVSQIVISNNAIASPNRGHAEAGDLPTQDST
jgi:hypothetical protein